MPIILKVADGGFYNSSNSLFALASNAISNVGKSESNSFGFPDYVVDSALSLLTKGKFAAALNIPNTGLLDFYSVYNSPSSSFPSDAMGAIFTSVSGYKLWNNEQNASLNGPLVNRVIDKIIATNDMVEVTLGSIGFRPQYNYIPGGPVWTMEAAFGGGMNFVDYSAAIIAAFTGNQAGFDAYYNNQNWQFTGAGGNDVFTGGSLADTIDGGDGEDEISGGAGNDSLIGGSGNDIFFGGDGNDIINGGSGTLDLMTLETNDAYGWIVDMALGTARRTDGFGVIDTDTFSSIEGFQALGGTNDFRGNGASSRFFGGDGSDIFRPGLGSDAVSGGDGNDTLQMAGSLTGFTQFSGNDTINMTTGIATRSYTTGSGPFQAFAFNTTTFSSIEIVDAFDGDDTVIGSARSDTIFGGGGSDLLFGGVGEDRLEGEQDNDTLWAFDGNDTLLGGTGNDSLFGEAGLDLLDGQDGADQLYGWIGNDTLLGGEGNDTIYGEQDNDVLYGWLGADLLWGGDGNDTLWGEQDNDTLLGEVGDDLLFGVDGNDVMYGWLGNDTLYGWTGADVLWGEQGNDLMLGEDGDDIFIGGLGRDTMTGGAGADQFFSAFSEIAAGDIDLITDFDAADRYLFQTGAQVQYFNFNAPGYGVGAGIHVQVAGGVFILDVFGANAAQLQAQTLFF